MKEVPRYTLEHAGHHFAVETAEVGLGYLARLFVDGELQDEQKARDERVRLRAAGGAARFTVEVRWGGFGQVKTCVLREDASGDRTKGDRTEGGGAEDNSAEGDKAGQTRDVPFDPPPGTRAAKLARFGRDHPHLYAARHLVSPVLQALLPLLGLGALFALLLPRIDWSWLPQPLYDKIFGDSPAWLEPILGSPVVQVAKWAVPIAIALLIAADEVQKRRTNRAKPGRSAASEPERTEERRGTHG